jgi:peptidyl-dipeptidase A
MACDPISHTIQDFLNKTNMSLSEKYAKMMHALWMVLTENSLEWAIRCEEYETAYLDELMLDTRVEQLDSLRLLPASCLLKHQIQELDVLYREMLEYRTNPSNRKQLSQAWNELHYRISTYRGKFDGVELSEREIHHILNFSTDETVRKKAWLAFMELGSTVAPPLIKLVHMRNEIARANGYSNHYALKMAAQEFPPDYINDVIRQLRQELEPVYRKVKKQIDLEVSRRLKISPNNIRSWHYPHPFFQSYAPQANEDVLCEWSSGKSRFMKWFKEQGVDLEPVMDRSHIADSQTKSAASFCLHLDRQGDIRLSCHTSYRRSDWSLLLHEVGHAFYESRIHQRLSFLLRQPASTFLSEAVALLFERLSYNQKWLDEIRGTQTFVNRQNEMTKAYYRNLIVKLYWTLSLVTFEQQLYEDPNQPLNRVWWDIVEDIQGITRPEEWDHPYWAAKAHLSTLPVYYHHYLLGEMAAAQLEESLSERFGIWQHPLSFEYLSRKLLAPGISKPWHEVMLDASGGVLSTSSLVRQIKKYLDE